MANVRDDGAFDYPSPAAYEPGRLFHNVFGIYVAQDQPVQDVYIRLHDRWRNYVETHRWHETQECHIDRNGHLIIRLQVRLSIELKRWVLWFGPEAEVLQPTALREEVANDVREAARRYAPEIAYETQGSAG